MSKKQSLFLSIMIFCCTCIYSVPAYSELTPPDETVKRFSELLNSFDIARKQVFLCMSESGPFDYEKLCNSGMKSDLESQNQWDLTSDFSNEYIEKIVISKGIISIYAKNMGDDKYNGLTLVLYPQFSPAEWPLKTTTEHVVIIDGKSKVKSVGSKYTTFYPPKGKQGIFLWWKSDDEQSGCVHNGLC